MFILKCEFDVFLLFNIFTKNEKNSTVYSNNTIYLNSFTGFIHTKHTKRIKFNLSGPVYFCRNSNYINRAWNKNVRYQSIKLA